MVDPEVRYTAAVARLRSAERKCAEAESELIAAEREVQTSRLGTFYYKKTREILLSEK